MEAARSLSAQQVLELTLRDEVISEVHEHLDEDDAKSRSTIASLEQQLSAIQKGGGADRPAHDKLLRLYDLEQQLASLELETQIARRSAQLQLLSPASPPDRPLPRALFSQAVLAAVLAAAAALTALFLDQRDPSARGVPLRAKDHKPQQHRGSRAARRHRKAGSEKPAVSAAKPMLA